MLGKPRSGETDEDILKLQEEFYRQKAENRIKASAKYVSASGSGKGGTGDLGGVPNFSAGPGGAKNEDALLERMVVGRIVERKADRDVGNIGVRFSKGFPEATRRRETKPGASTSIFAQQSRKRSATARPTPINEFVSTEKLQRTINAPSRSYIVTGENAGEIHEENVAKLSEMTEEEIVAEQQRLCDSLDPEIVKFFKAKRQAEPMVVEDVVQPVDIVDVSEIETVSDIVERSRNWLNFDVVETEKLQWMRNMSESSKRITEPHEARFDFDGWLLPFSETITERNRTLFHHGTEPERPGYSLSELFRLARSNVQQQRIVAFDTISKILEVNGTGVYENVIEIPIEQIFFVARIGVDENSTVVNAALKTLHRIFYSKIDETCLDAAAGFGNDSTQPILIATDDNVDDVNDQKLAEIDLVRTLFRTDILIRLRYILTTLKTEPETVTYVLELLTRIARDSRPVFNALIETEGLLNVVIDRNAHPAALKLLRVIASRDIAIASLLAPRIVPRIVPHIATSTDVKLQTESLRLFAVFLQYRLCIDRFREIVPFLLRNLEYYVNVDAVSYVKQSHFAAVAAVVRTATEVNGKFLAAFLPTLELCCGKYCERVAKSTEWTCGSLGIVSSVLDLAACCTSPFNDRAASLLKSRGFDLVTKNVEAGSNLLCGYESLKSAANLRFVEAVVWRTSEHVVPVLLSTSCVLFLAAVSKFVAGATKDMKIAFVRHPNVLRYLESLRNAPLCLTTNWFTKIETRLLMNVFKCVIDVRDALDDPMFYYELIVKCIGLFGAEFRESVDELLRSVVFNRDFYPNEVLINEMSIGDDVEKNCLKNLPEVYEMYAKFLGLKRRETGLKSLSLDVRVGNIVPVDWMYGPIVSMYAKEMKKDDAEQERVLTRCLQWIFLYETHFPALSALIGATERFCRLCCVFLASNSLFLDGDVQKLLRGILDLLVTEGNYKKLDFDGEIQGLNNFQDFYTELLEHYQGVSYGDKLFANFLLVPLAQRHNVKWRKTLWSEYEGIVQIVNLTEHESILNVDEFTTPIETDASLIECYRRSLRTGHLNRSPLLRQIVMHHLKNQT